MSHCSSSNTSAGFVDLATCSELETYQYGGLSAISYFVAGVQKANWFSIVPIQLRSIGTLDFGQECVSSSVNRSGDYVLNTWFRCEIPTIVYKAGLSSAANNSVRWTRNLMHNLIKCCSITFNELVVHTFDNYWLDFSTAYRIKKEKRVAYNNMIGNVSSLTQAIAANTATQQDGLAGGALFGGAYSVPLPFFFTEDSGIALPIAALPFNDVKINYEFRNIEDLLVFTGAANFGINDIVSGTATFSATTGAYVFAANTSHKFTHGATHAHYAVIHNDERVKMGEAPRDYLIRQVQSICGTDVTPGATEHCTDIRLSHSIISFFFGFRNTTIKGDMSNYTTNFSFGNCSGSNPPVTQPVVGNAGHWYNPIKSTSLIYENTVRLNQDSDFFSLIHPYYFSDAVSEETGMHMWSYALKPWDALSPSGGTNYSKLANVQLKHQLSERATYYSTTGNTLGGSPLGSTAVPLKLKSVFIAQSANVARIANGSFGHPSL